MATYRILHNLSAQWGRPYRRGDRLWPGYTGTIPVTGTFLEDVFRKHNMDDRPDGQTAPSLSVGDVVVIEGDEYSVAGYGFEVVVVDADDIMPEGTMDYGAAFDLANKEPESVARSAPKYNHYVVLTVRVEMDDMDDPNPEASAEIALDLLTQMVHDEWDATATVEVAAYGDYSEVTR